MSAEGTYAPKSPDLSSFYSSPTPPQDQAAAATGAQAAHPQRVLSQQTPPPYFLGAPQPQQQPGRPDRQHIPPRAPTYFAGASSQPQQHQLPPQSHIHQFQQSPPPPPQQQHRLFATPPQANSNTDAPTNFGQLGSPPGHEYFTSQTKHHQAQQQAQQQTQRELQRLHLQYGGVPGQEVPHPQLSPGFAPQPPTTQAYYPPFSTVPHEAYQPPAVTHAQQQQALLPHHHQQYQQHQQAAQQQQQQQHQLLQQYQPPPTQSESKSPDFFNMPPRRAAAQASGSAATPAIEPSPVKTKFPTARIKRIMQADEEVGKVAQQTPIAVGKALEMFMVHLVTKSAEVAREKNSKRVSAQMLKQVVETDDQWDFLRDIVSRVENEKEGGGGKGEKVKGKTAPSADQPTESEAESEVVASEPSKKKGRGGRKKKVA